MRLSYSDEDLAFRQEVRDFLRSAVPADMAHRTRHGVHTSKDDLQTWNRILNERGWAAAHWPAEYGGSGWTPAKLFIFEDECASADAPFLSFFGLRLVGPLIYTFGTDEQKAKYLPSIRSGETFWCQGFSEPAAGSDLASVLTTAVRDGDHYIVNGQKTWTTEAHFADKMFCLARTDPNVRPQKGGLSILLFDLDQPGITIRPIVTIDGGHSVNEVFLENVRVPAHDVLGREGQGWDQAKFLLANERVTNAHVPQCKRELQIVRELAQSTFGGESFLDDPHLSGQLAQIEIDLQSLEWMVLAELFSDRHTGDPRRPSSLKIIGSEIQQRISDLAVEIAGPRGLVGLIDAEASSNDRPADIPDAFIGIAERQLFRRATTIYAGTNEIQRGIISRAMLA